MHSHNSDESGAADVELFLNKYNDFLKLFFNIVKRTRSCNASQQLKKNIYFYFTFNKLGN